MTAGNLLARRRATLGPHALLFYDQPLEFVRGSGVWLYDAAGRAYLDVYNNVPHVGHAHPRVAEAIARAAAELATHTRYLHEAPVACAERLLATLPGFDRLSYVCTGTEANELALRMARYATGARGVIVSSASYHGNSTLLAALTTGLPSTEPFPDWARAVQVNHAFSQNVAQACDELMQAGHGVAALLLCPVLSFEGMPAIDSVAFQAVVATVHKSGGLIIADEVQGGLGRLGAAFWSHQVRSLKPDLVTMGKPLGNGYPIGAVATTAQIADPFMRDGLYFNTFAGNPVACAAALATLRVLEDENLMQHACKTGARLTTALQSLTGTDGPFSDIRGMGLFQGAVVRGGEAAARTWINQLAKTGVLVGRTGPNNDILKIRPPMPFASEHVDLLLNNMNSIAGFATNENSVKTTGYND